MCSLCEFFNSVSYVFLLLGYLIVKRQKDVLLNLQRKQTGRIVDYINHFEVSMEVIGAHVFSSR